MGEIPTNLLIQRRGCFVPSELGFESEQGLAAEANGVRVSWEVALAGISEASLGIPCRRFCCVTPGR